MQISFELIIAGVSLFLAVISLVIAFFSLQKSRILTKRSEVLFSGKTGKDLEEIILDHSEEIKALDGEIQHLFEISNKIHALSLRGLHKFEVIRFNPFKDIGGDQSFAIALLDGKNNGLVISSLHTREGTRVYAKPLKKGEGDGYTLTEEEKQAILQATKIKPSKL